MLITTSHAAKILDTSEGTVRALERRGELPCKFRTSTNIRLFEQSDVERVARERAERRAAAAAAGVEAA
jgi:DNA-binding transcriptional MerR regulator